MIYSRKAEIDQIAEGLQSFQLLSFLRNNTEIGYHTLHAQKSPALTVDSFLDLFVIHDQAEEGSTREQCKMEFILIFLILQRTFLLKVSDCLSLGDHWTYCLSVEIDINGDILKLSNVLSFLTGSEEIPLCTYHVKPSLHLNQGLEGFMTVSTCSLKAYFGVHHAGEYEKFRDDFVFAIGNAPGYFRV